VKLVFQSDFYDVWDAIAAEKQIKGWSRKKKEALIEGRFDDLPKLSRNQQP
jgi:putative endonuclease